MAVDWTFLQEVEGQENTTYIPMEDGKPIQNSGVTIGTGVDLGQQSKAKFEKLGLPDELINKLAPFFGKTQDKAVKALEKNGEVTLDDDEILAIDKALKKATLEETKKWYNKTNTMDQDWSDLSDQQQTVILSVRYNHGPAGAPNFYRQVTSGDWTAAVDNLLNFYPSKDNELHERRVKEAQYLSGLPLEEIDGIVGPITTAAVEKFKNTVGVSSPDQVRPEQPQIGSVAYINNLMEIIRKARKTGAQAATEPSGRTDREKRIDQLLKESLGDTRRQTIARGERRLEQTYNEVLAEEEGESFSKKEEKNIQRAMELMGGKPRKSEKVVLRETTNPPKEQPQETEERPRDDSKDPIYGIF
jgi:GH24 family phage-related lysozyme (muramidase)